MELTLTQKEMEDIQARFGFHKLTEPQMDAVHELRSKFTEMAMVVVAELPAGRHRQLFLTHLEQAETWAVKAKVGGYVEEPA